MAKVYKVVDQPETSNVLCLTTNCVLCQEDTLEVLHCPAYSKCDRVGYNTDNIKGFDNVGCLPKTVKVR